MPMLIFKLMFKFLCLYKFFFSFQFDLSGIKWRRYCSDSIYVDILDDPVLLTYSECISSGVLAAWRRIPNQKHGGYHMQEESNGLSGYKELWIFWCGDDPDFPRLLKSNLYGTFFFFLVVIFP